MIEMKLYEYMRELLKQTPTTFVRYKYNDISWDSRLVGILGPRGIGKSTMILQRIKNTPENHSLYITADNIYFADHKLFDLADKFVKEGGTHLYIDEVHKYSGWSRELKLMYDMHPSLHIVFTGSSVLDIYRGESDLSRRALLYFMYGLSFREYLSFFHGIDSPVYALDDILSNRAVLDAVEHPLPLFRDYMSRGYYPFSVQGDFPMRMEQVVTQTIEVDIPQYADMKASTARKLKQLLAILSHLAPYKPIADSLASEIGASKNSIPDYLAYLEKSGMIGLLRDDTSGIRNLGKIEKVYIDNPSLMTVLAGGTPNIGNLRETFFYNQMRVRNAVTASRQSDFVIGKYTFEIGGRKKGKQQIEGLDNAYIVKDDIETGFGNIIPLWCFGLNY